MKTSTILVLVLLLITFVPTFSLGSGSSEFSFDKAEAEGYVAFVVNTVEKKEDNNDQAGPDPDINKCACKGTGSITHGDGHKTPCPYHSKKDDDTEDETDLINEKQVIFFTAKWCGPCQQWKSKEIPKLEKSGWKGSDQKNAMIRIMDVDKNKDFWNKHRVGGSVPQFLLFEKGKRTNELIGFHSATQVANMYNKK